MMKSRPILLSLLLVSVLSCEQAESLEMQPAEAAPVLFSLDTKGLESGRTYRVTLVSMEGVLRGVGTYCSIKIEPGVTGQWLSPCLVNNDGEPEISEGVVASSLEEADKDAKYGLRFPTSSPGSTENVYISAASPAVKLETEGKKRYYIWDSQKELLLSSPDIAYPFVGSWLNNEYVFDFSAKEALELLDRRALFSVRIACGDQTEAYVNSVKLTHVDKARWYLPGYFATTNNSYSKTGRQLYDYSNNLYDENGQPLHLIKENGDALDTGEIYILPVDYSQNEYADMRPQLEILLGEDVHNPKIIKVELSQNIETQKKYRLILNVSKDNLELCFQKELPWDEVNAGGTPDNEKWATIGWGQMTTWDDGGTISTDNWNNAF